MNWVETIALIQRAGYSQSQIAAACGCAQPTINDLATGKTKEPRYSVGEALKRLAKRVGREAARA